jgi:restriction alleviation protein Lar
MMEPLSCPFCGAQPEQEAFGYYHMGTESREIRCKNPICKVRPYIILDQEEDQFDLVEAWNDRCP